MANEELKLLGEFEKDSGWFHNNIDKLQENNFSGKFVAVHNEKPIAADKNIDVVIKMVEKAGKNPSCVFIEFVYPKGFTLLL
ncbi:hypothetical protein J4433_00510 [Candidatus Pacearchaeota archaeon]|nr:hypothetical protein [Candidatus Pacearchaeota archaeon]